MNTRKINSFRHYINANVYLFISYLYVGCIGRGIARKPQDYDKIT